MILYLLSTAFAEDYFAPGGVLDFLPAGEIVGDGSTPVAMHFLALNPDGTGISGIEAKVTATEGTVSNWTDAGNGWYAFTFVPPKAVGQKVVTLKLKGKTADKKKYEADGNVLVLAPTARRITISANPPAMNLGQDVDSTLSFVLEGTAGQPLKGADLVFSASVGEVQNLTDMTGGRFTAKYLPPKGTNAALAIVTAADRRDPSRTYGHVVIPLNGKLDYKVQSKPSSDVLLQLGGRDFGPVKTDGKGRATIPVAVPPGTTIATLTTMVNGNPVQEVVDPKVPEGRRLELIPFQAGLPADGTTVIPVRVAVRNPDGTPDTAATPVFMASAGSVGSARHEGDGIYAAEYTTAALPAATVVTISASVGGAVQTDKATLNLVPVRATKIELMPVPPALPPGPQKFALEATVTGPGDVGLAARSLVLNLTGAKAEGPVQDLKAGKYRADLATTGSGPVDVLATVPAAPTGNPLRRVAIFPTRERVPNDGISATMLTVITVDEFGYPAANVPVTFKIDRGDGSLPATATTGPNGVAQVFYTAGRKPQLVEITALAGDHLATQTLLQVPMSFPALDLPDDGTDATRALAAAWSPTVTFLRVERAKP